MRITKTSISRPVTITILFIGIAFFGVFAFSKLGIGLLPNINIARLVVQASYPNAVPKEIIREMVIIAEKIPSTMVLQIKNEIKEILKSQPIWAK